MATRQALRPKPGTQRLSELAAHVVLPAGIVSTDWPRVRDTCERAGIHFDKWQDGAGRAILALDAHGKYAADTVVLSIPRQVGKTFMLGAIVFALCQIHAGMTVIWTAHHTRTAGETFSSMQAFAKMPKVAPRVSAVRRAAGEQGIIFTNGSRILFGAREQGFGRGFAGVDVVMFDEAQILTESAVDDILPATNQAKTGNPLILMAGTPPRPKDPGEVFTNRRREALESGSGNGDTLYIEFSADPAADVTDRAQWARANPSYPHRTPAKAIQRLLKHLGSASFRREALGIWDATSRATPAVDPERFKALGVTERPAITQVAYGVKFSPDGSRMALSGAISTDAGAFVEVIDSSSTSVGLAGITRWLADRARDCDAIVIDGKGAAGTLNELLLDAGVNHRKIIRPTFDWVVTANSALVESVLDGSLSHSNQPGLIHAVENTTRKDRGETGGWVFSPIVEGTDVPALQSAALAMHGLGGTRRRNGRKTGTRGRMVAA
jgi:hypothetical protein